MIEFLDARGLLDVVAERYALLPSHALSDTGYIEGENVEIVYRFAENQSTVCRSWRPTSFAVRLP